MAPSKVVVDEGTLSCPAAHGGQRKLSGVTGTPPAKLRVGTSRVVPLESAGGDGGYAKCAFADNSGPHPCKQTAIASTGAAKLTVGGRPVLLDTDTVTSSNDQQLTFPVTVDPAQSKLTAS
jgi:hypothetical protein